MARRPRPKRRERRQRSNVLLRRLGLALVLALPLLYFAFTKLFFDPFEGGQPVFSALVPRDVGLYARRERLDSDLVDLRPHLWDDLVATRPYKDLAQTEWWKSLEWPTEVEAQLAQLKQVAATSPLNLMDDLLGHEVAVVGRLPAGGEGDPGFAVLLRISSKAKLAVELLDYDAVLSRALPGAERSKVDDPDVPGLSWHRLDVPEEAAPGAGGSWFYARRLDLLVVSRDESLVRDVLRQIQSGDQTSLGLSRMYQDQMPPPTGAADERLSLEFVTDGQPLLARLGLAAPPPAGPGDPDMLKTVLGRLIDVSRLGEIAGRLELDDRLSLRLSADLADPPAGSTPAGLRGAPAFVLRDRLKSALGLLPSDTTAVVTMNAALRPLLELIASALGPDELKLLNDTIRDVSRHKPDWRVDSVPALISWLDKALGDEITIAMRQIGRAHV